VGPLGELSPPAVQADLKDGSDKAASRLGKEEEGEEKEEADKVTKMDQHNTSESQTQTASLSPSAPSDQQLELGMRLHVACKVASASIPTCVT